jgi:hypothetical protein
MPQDLPHDELDWLAYRYVAGELSPDEEQSFEARLGDDQPAREAVEQAFELTQAMRIAARSLPEPASGGARVTGRFYGWAAVVAACLLIACLGWLWSGGDPADRQFAEEAGTTDEAAAVALAWAEVRGWQTRGQPAADAAAAPPAPDWPALEPDLGSGEGVKGDIELPAWLWTVAEARSAQRTEESH